MAGRFLLDTNIVIAHFEGDEAVTERLEAVGQALIPAPVVAELLYGAQKSRRIGYNADRVFDLVRVSVFVPCGLAACEQYARIKLAVARMGRPIPVNDLWIAACCAAAEATLVTRDGHFDGVPGLQIEAW